MLVWVLTAVAAPPEGFSKLRDWNDCVLYKRPRTQTSPSAMRAECEWPTADAEVLGALIRDFDSYDTWIWPVGESEVRRVETDRTLVYQLQQVWGISDREVLLWATVDELGDGVRSSWTTASEEPMVRRKKTIRTPQNEGFWQVRQRPEGGASVVHQIAVNAGGVPLPGWLVRAIQSRGLGRLMDEVLVSSQPKIK